MKPIFRVVLITCSNSREAEEISKNLIREKLAACVNIVSGVKSYFRWKGKMDRSEEILLIVKTSSEKIGQLIEAVKKIHSYAVPEIISLPIAEGNEDYLSWLGESIK